MTSSDLNAVQRWLLAVITHQDGVRAGVESPEAKQLIEMNADQIEQVVTRSARLDAFDRLAVYGNAYFARLLECLRDEFPALAEAIGEDAFDGFALGYIQQHPPSSYTLADLGARFPQHLRATCPADGERPNWTDFVIELATLERTYSEVFDAEGPEETPLLTKARLEAVEPGDWPNSQLHVAPWVRLAEFQYPVHEYATAVRVQGESPLPPTPHKTFLAISRRDYVVRRTPLSEPQFHLLGGLQAGRTVVEAIAAAAGHVEDEADFAVSLQRWFFDWTAAGFFLDVTCDG